MGPCGRAWGAAPTHTLYYTVDFRRCVQLCAAQSLHCSLWAATPRPRPRRGALRTRTVLPRLLPTSRYLPRGWTKVHMLPIRVHLFPSFRDWPGVLRSTAQIALCRVGRRLIPGFRLTRRLQTTATLSLHHYGFALSTPPLSRSTAPCGVGRHPTPPAQVRRPENPQGNVDVWST